MQIKKGDNIIIITGKDKGKKAKVVKVLRDSNKVVIEGLNVVKKHQKPRGNTKGQTIEVSMPMHVSNVMLIDPKKGVQTRIGSKIVNGKKIRVSKKSGQEI